jgi:uncharacterized protein YidB (DUF937 family)
MSPSKGRSAVVGATALAATAALGLPGVAYAQSADQPSQSQSAHPGPGRHGPHLETAAGVLNLSVEDLRTRLRDGKTLAEVANDQGVAVQTLIDALVAEASDHIDQKVADGELTAEEAAERKATLPERIEELVNNEFPARGPGAPGGPGGHGGPLSLEKAATALGISADDLRGRLRDGTTLAQVAQEQGVDVETLIAALVADATGRIDQAVADGKLTADQATERKANLTGRITKFVNEGRPARPEGGPPPNGERPMQPEGSSFSSGSSS